MKIAVDFDGVLMRTNEALIEVFNNKYGSDLKYNDITSWKMWEIFNCKEEEVLSAFLELVDYDWAKIPMEPKANYFLGKMHPLCHLDILTDRTFIPNTLEKVENKLKLEGIMKGTHYRNLIDTKGVDKKEFGYDLYVDDNPEMAKSEKGTLILFDQPWNKEVKSKEFNDNLKILEEMLACPENKVFRAKNWSQVYEYFLKFFGGCV
ncbi:MAG: hypothetical protein PHG04_04185 [Candidatus Nanoarchaeia archaeon]|nr:hypothetical protein [Candidatus Nanoarchaeia archaeon]